MHTGQHYDRALSDLFFEEMDIPRPDHELGVGSGSHGRQTGQMLIGIEEVLLAERPDWVLVYGDTNSTLAGALAAVKLGIPVAHVEAGLRSFNRAMPEEHNRILTDHCADLLLCPTQTAVDLLRDEGVTRGVHLVGDVMFDAALQFAEVAHQRSTILAELGLTPKVVTPSPPCTGPTTPTTRIVCVRCWQRWMRWKCPSSLPLHPRTRSRLAEMGHHAIRITPSRNTCRPSATSTCWRWNNPRR